MRIATYNTNGIRARQSLLLQWLETHQPDVLGLQETKVQDADFPVSVWQQAGYEVVFKGQKSFNGVAIFSRHPLEEVQIGFDGPDDEGTRLIAARIQGLHLVNTYIPQGQAPNSEQFAYKLNWFKRLRHYFERRFTPATPLIWLGDINVAPGELDVHDPVRLKGSVGFHPDEHAALQAIMSWGFTDLFRHQHPAEQAFTFWDYRVPNGVKRNLGWRIDHILVTSPVVARTRAIWIDQEARRQPKPSDHTFVVADVQWPPDM